MKKILIFLSLIVFSFNYSQNIVSGTVTDETGVPLPGATVLAIESGANTITDFDGNYSISAEMGTTLEFRFIGYAVTTISVSGTSLDLSLSPDNALDEVIVTALGVSRDKKSLGYSVQGVDGDDVSDVKSMNALESLSGEVSGLDISSYNTMGGSANVIIRGYSSLTGSNQALFIVDGTPINNDIVNSNTTGRGGFDYGNAAMDINPDDIETVSVLKGSAATALYGSRASNGVILITTKKGKSQEGLGISINSSVMVGSIDNETMPVYQTEYGAGYGPFYYGPGGRYDLWGDNLSVLTGEDASYGPLMEGQMVHHWFNMIPEWGDYKGMAPYQDPGTTAHDFFKNSLTTTNSVSFSGGDDDSSFRLSYTNASMEGIMENATIERNTFNLSGSKNFGDLDVSAGITYTKTEGVGRYGTGYDNRNVFQGFRQWWITATDILQQKQVYEETGKNYSWNMYGPGARSFDEVPNTKPHYFDNPYWMRHNTYNTDVRNRYFGNLNLDYELTDEISILGRVGFDQYDEIREERINVGSVDVSSYSFTNRIISEFNYDLILSFNTDITEDLNLDAIVGWNLRVNQWDIVGASTNGGLNFPNIYSLDNSVNPLTSDNTSNYDATKKVDGIYARASFGYQNTYYLEGTFRRDRSSTLPIANNTYTYPSVSGSVILSNLIDASWLSFAKLRANFAQVGNDVGPYRTLTSYIINAGFGGQASSTNPSTFNNSNLVAEKTDETEFGIEVDLFNSRVGLDISVYDKTTEDLITPVNISGASGATANFINGGSIENKGVELILRLVPVKTDDFSWNLNFNYAKNKSKVLSLASGLEFLQLASVQGGVSIGGKPGEPYGVIRGKDHIYVDGQPMVYTTADAPSGSYVGVYARTSSTDNILGDINPDWTGGIKNTLRYKNLKASFLIDIQQGGDFFSLDTYYGFATGIYDRSVGLNELGNPIRNSIADGGGVILPGVNADGSPNQTRGRTDWYANPYGYSRGNNKMHVYDASFVKLREVSIGYDFSGDIVSSTPFTSASVSIIGRNLWIISKNSPYTDPEAGLSAGNVQGNQSGAYPSIKEVGVNVKLEF